MVDFKNLAWATSFATRASRKFIYLPLQGKWGKKLLSYPAHTGPLCHQYIIVLVLFTKVLVRFPTSQRTCLHSPAVQVPHRTAVAPVYHIVGSLLHIPEDLSTLTRHPSLTQGHCAHSISQCWFCLSRCWFDSPHPKGSIYTHQKSRFHTGPLCHQYISVGSVCQGAGSILHIPRIYIYQGVGSIPHIPNR